MRQFNTLRAGMSESEVEIVMGAPDYARCDLSKKGDKFVGSVWQYAVAVPQDAANDSQNSSIADCVWSGRKADGQERGEHAAETDSDSDRCSDADAGEFAVTGCFAGSDAWGQFDAGFAATGSPSSDGNGDAELGRRCIDLPAKS